MFEMYDIDLVSSRLRGAIVRVDGTYVQIQEINKKLKGFQASIMDKEGKLTLAYLNKDNVRYDNMRIGMVWLDGYIHWSARNPVRRWKVGLNSYNFITRRRDSGRATYLKARVFNNNIGNIINMLDGNYPPWETVIRNETGCLSRHFSVYANYLYYKHFKCGYFKLGKFFLKKRWHYLRERFEEEVACTPEFANF